MIMNELSDRLHDSSKSAACSIESAPIAVIGMSGRFPGGADSVAQLWKKLLAGADCISDASGERWDLGYYDLSGQKPGKIYAGRADS